MKLCKNDICIPICNFCAFYNFNGDSFGIYKNRGWCKLLHKRKDPAQDCKRFHCYMALSIENFKKYTINYFRNRPKKIRNKYINEMIKSYKNTINEEKLCG